MYQFSQTLPAGEYNFSLKEKSNTNSFLLLKNHYKPVFNPLTELSAAGELKSFRHSSKTWRFRDMTKEYLYGAGFGAALGLLAGAIGSIGHILGDTSSSASNKVRVIVLTLMGAGHTLGVAYGIHKAGDLLDVNGNGPLSLAGILLGQGTAIYMLTRDKKWMNWAGAGIMLLITPLLGTLGFNSVF